MDHPDPTDLAAVAERSWAIVALSLRERSLVRRREATSCELRSNDVHSCCVALHALDSADGSLIRWHTEQRPVHLVELGELDRRKRNRRRGGLSLAGAGAAPDDRELVATATSARHHLQIALSGEEQGVEDTVRRGGDGLT